MMCFASQLFFHILWLSSVQFHVFDFGTAGSRIVLGHPPTSLSLFSFDLYVSSSKIPRGHSNHFDMSALDLSGGHLVRFSIAL